MTDSQLSVPCARCGRPSAPHGEHHHRPEWGPVGKGMGGTHDHLERIPTCREHHEEVHLRVFTFMVVGDFVSTWADGHCQSERALTVNDSHQDKRYWSDEQLGLLWAQLDERAVGLFAGQCEVAWQFKCRIGWGEGWAEQCAHTLVQAGVKANPGLKRRIEERASLWTTFKDNWEDFQTLGPTICIAVAESDDPEGSLNYAAAAYLGDGKRAKDVAAEVRRGEPKEIEYCECPECGNKHRRKKEA